MIRFFGQPKYALNDPKTLIGYEFLLREWHGDHWQVPSDFSQYLAADIVNLLDQTLAVLPKDLPLLSFNLDQAQFVDPAFEQALAELHLKRPVHLVVELTEHDDHVSVEALSEAASNMWLQDCGCVLMMSAPAPIRGRWLKPWRLMPMNISLRCKISALWHD
jgi:EAL domain-containing protein (putative c-di-GMP-specific phosphodiesterase class I)